MCFNVKTARRELIEIAWTGIDLKDLIAGSATEMMMVPKVCELVAGRLTREVDRGDLPPFNQIANGSVNRCST